MTDQSIFAQAAQQQQTITTGVDNSSGTQQPTIPDLSELVGEGKKYKTTEEALAALPHAQAHIAQLEAENKRLAEQAAKLDILLAKLDKGDNEQQAQQPQTEQQQQANAQQPGQTDTQVTPDKVEEIVNQLRQKEIAEANYKKAEEALKNRYGDKLPEVLNNASKELGMSLEEMQAVAERSPTAFLNMLGINDKASSHQANPTVPGNTSTNTQQEVVRNFAYYEKIRKQDPSTYWNESVQVQMHKDAEALGDAFFAQ